MATIEIVSFSVKLHGAKRVSATAEIINNCKADMLLFSGHTLDSGKDIVRLKERISNKLPEVIFEVKDVNSGMVRNCLYRIAHGKIFNMNTNQLFSESKEIEDNYELADRFLHELYERRILTVDNIKYLILQCGEINILRNYQNQNNQVDFRLPQHQDLSKKFNALLNNIKVIINPIHSPMGNQGKMHKRREFLSSRKRYYFSTSNTDEKNDNLNNLSLHYAYFNEKPINPININKESNYISRSFELIDL